MPLPHHAERDASAMQELKSLALRYKWPFLAAALALLLLIAGAVGLALSLAGRDDPTPSVTTDPLPLPLPEWYTPGKLDMQATAILYGAAQQASESLLPALSRLELPETIRELRAVNSRYLQVIDKEEQIPSAALLPLSLYDTELQQYFHLGDRLAYAHPSLFSGVFEENGTVCSLTFPFADPDLCFLLLQKEEEAAKGYLIRISSAETTSLPEGYTLICLSPCGRYALLRKMIGKELYLLTLATGDAVQLPVSTNIMRASDASVFSPDGEYLLAYRVPDTLDDERIDEDTPWCLFKTSSPEAFLEGRGILIHFTERGDGLILRTESGIEALSLADLSPLPEGYPFTAADRYEAVFFSAGVRKGLKLVPLLPMEGEVERVLTEQIDAVAERDGILYLYEQANRRILIFSRRNHEIQTVASGIEMPSTAEDLLLSPSPDGTRLRLYGFFRRDNLLPPVTSAPNPKPPVTKPSVPIDTDPAETTPPQTIPPETTPLLPVPEQMTLSFVTRTAYLPIRDIVGFDEGGWLSDPFPQSLAIRSYDELSAFLAEVEPFCHKDLTRKGMERYDEWAARYDEEWFSSHALVVTVLSSNRMTSQTEGKMTNTLIPPSATRVEIKAASSTKYRDFDLVLHVESTPCRYESAVFLVSAEVENAEIDPYGKRIYTSVVLSSDRAGEEPLSRPPVGASRPDSRPVTFAERFSSQAVYLPIYNGAFFNAEQIQLIDDYSEIEPYVKQMTSSEPFFDYQASAYGLPTMEEQLTRYTPAWFEKHALVLIRDVRWSSDGMPLYTGELEDGILPPPSISHLYLEDGVLHAGVLIPRVESESSLGAKPYAYAIFAEIERSLLAADSSVIPQLVDVIAEPAWEVEPSHRILRTESNPAKGGSTKSLVPVSVGGSSVYELQVTEYDDGHIVVYATPGGIYLHDIEPFAEILREAGSGYYEITPDSSRVSYLDSAILDYAITAEGMAHGSVSRLMGYDLPIKRIRPLSAEEAQVTRIGYTLRREGDEISTEVVPAKLSGIFTATVSEVDDSSLLRERVTLKVGRRTITLEIPISTAAGLEVDQTYLFNLSTDRICFVSPLRIGKQVSVDQLAALIDWSSVSFRPATRAEKAAMACDLILIKPSDSHTYRHDRSAEIALPSVAGAMTEKTPQTSTAHTLTTRVLVLREELEATMEQLRALYETASVHQDMPAIPSLDELLAKYDEDWFRTNDLVLVCPEVRKRSELCMTWGEPSEELTFPYRQVLKKQGNQLLIELNHAYHRDGAYCLLYEVAKSEGITSARLICRPK